MSVGLSRRSRNWARSRYRGKPGRWQTVLFTIIVGEDDVRDDRFSGLVDRRKDKKVCHDLRHCARGDGDLAFETTPLAPLLHCSPDGNAGVVAPQSGPQQQEVSIPEVCQLTMANELRPFFLSILAR